ncbi:MAG: DUF2927 domain-containing protein [Rhodospirillales bacterium]
MLTALLLSLALGGCQTAAQKLEDDRARAIAFLTEITFGDNSDVVDQKTLPGRRIARWAKAPTISIEGKPSDIQREAVAESARKLSGATRFDIRVVDRDGDIRIDFSDKQDFVTRRTSIVGCYSFPIHRSGRIRSAEIKIGRRYGPDSVICLDHELMHAFGFFGHSTRLRSVMSSVHTDQRFTEWDLLALRIIYNPGIYNNATWEDIELLARILIDEALQ